MVKVKEDLTGMKFDRLTVLYQTDDYIVKGNRYAKYHCICNCNEHNEIDVLATQLTHGKTKSCGCLRKEASIKRTKKYNDYYIIDDIVYIKLSNCDEYTMVSLDDWNKNSYIRNFYWHKGSEINSLSYNSAYKFKLNR